MKKNEWEAYYGQDTKPSKYGARKVIVDGVTFDSSKEYIRWKELQLLERGGEICGLQRQVKFPLLPAQEYKGKRVEAPVSYIADFTYIDHRTGEYVVEDVKGFKTKEYILKRKMMLYFHKLRIREV